MWFNKKKEDIKNTSNLPKLPELPELPETQESFFPSSENTNPMLHQEKDELPSLPIFPNSETANKMSREAIKSALETKPKPYTQEISPSRYKMRESLEPLRHKEVGEEMINSSPFQAPKTHQISEPIFVRIDKFQQATKSINEIKKQISEIENYLSEVRKIKTKEEQELQEWEHEISEIKSKLDSIDKTLFSKLE